jgi:hypothetical protein
MKMNRRIISHSSFVSPDGKVSVIRLRFEGDEIQDLKFSFPQEFLAVYTVLESSRGVWFDSEKGWIYSGEDAVGKPEFPNE